MREFVRGCDDFVCDSLEKHLSKIDQLKKERENWDKELKAMQDEFYKIKKEDAAEL